MEPPLSSPGQERFGSEFVAPSFAIWKPARYSWRALFIVPVIWPFVNALVNAGTAKPARTAMIEITTRSSIREKADVFFMGGVGSPECGPERRGSSCNRRVGAV